MRNTYDKQFDELLSDAFRKQYENELKNGPADEDLSAMHPFTDEHMKKAEQLSRKNKKQSSLWKTGFGKAAAVILCVGISGGIIAATNPEVIGNVGSTVVNWFGEYVSIDFSDAEQNLKITIAKTEIGYIPVGFELDKDNSDKDTLSRIYVNEAGEYIIIDIEESSDINLMTEKDSHEVTYCTINGYEGYLSYSDDLRQGSVYFGSSYFTVAISGMTEKDELIKIAENIVFKD